MKKTVFLGAVQLSAAALRALLDAGIPLDLVCSLDEAVSKNVSDYYPLHDLAAEYGVPALKFRKVTDIQEQLSAMQIDTLYVIGISQLIPKSLIDAVGCAIGFHPTPLPRYRGRAPIPWMILLGVERPMVTLFRLDEGADSGDILCQEPYTIGADDYAGDVYASVCSALQKAIARCADAVYQGTAVFCPQEESQASYTLIRRPEDGEICWNDPAEAIYRLIRAAAAPYPGAFTGYRGEKIVIARAGLSGDNRYIGLPGQIAKIDGDGAHVLAGDGRMVILREYTPARSLVVGTKFGQINKT